MPEFFSIFSSVSIAILKAQVKVVDVHSTRQGGERVKSGPRHVRLDWHFQGAETRPRGLCLFFDRIGRLNAYALRRGKVV